MRGHDSIKDLQTKIINLGCVIGPTFTIRRIIYDSYIFTCNKYFSFLLPQECGGRSGRGRRDSDSCLTKEMEDPIAWQVSPDGAASHLTKERMASKPEWRYEQRDGINTALRSNLFEFILISRGKKIFLNMFNVLSKIATLHISYFSKTVTGYSAYFIENFCFISNHFYSSNKCYSMLINN